MEFLTATPALIAEYDGDPLADLLQQCTVRIEHNGKLGTGFFAAPGYILTCAHVLGETSAKSQQIAFTWQGKPYEAALEKLIPDPCPADQIFPDIALLSTALSTAPYALLAPGYRLDDDFFSFGYSGLRKGGESLSSKCEGSARYDDSPEKHLIKFKDTQVLPGVSGAPLLNRRTGGICGIIKRTRGEETDLGGLAVRMELVLDALPELALARPPGGSAQWREVYWLSKSTGKQAQGVDRNRLALLERVRTGWIDRVLNQSLYKVARFELRLEQKEDAVESPLDVTVRIPGRDPVAIPPGTSIAKVFDDLHGAILILGAPGTGKSTLLLELAGVLLDRALRDESHPLPAVFNLASWASKPQKLSSWLIAELNGFYRIPTGVARKWVENGEVLPLLDGLDEVDLAQRGACLDAINEFRSEWGLLPIAVCSRIADFEDLGKKIRLEGAVVVKPLTGEQVDDYLARGGAEMASLRSAITRDPTLALLLETPLMLWVAMLAFENASVEIVKHEDLEQKRRRIFASFVERMFERESSEAPFPKESTLRWLSWLASSLLANNLTIFALENLDRKIFPTRRMRWVSPILTFAGVSLAYGLICWLLTATGYGLSGVLIFLLERFTTFHTPGLDWSEQGGYAFYLGRSLAIVLGPSGGLIAALSNLRPSERLQFGFKGAKTRVVQAVQVGLISGLSFGIVGVTFAGFDTWEIWAGCGCLCGLMRLLSGENPGDRSSANEGTWRSVKVALALVLSGVLISLFGGLQSGLFAWLFCALVIGGFAGGLFSLKHFVLRLILRAIRAAPLNYVAFLNYATDRLFLTKVGSGYMFRHRFLMEYFASLPNEGAPASRAPSP